MSVAQFILQYLAENGKAKVPHFGVFTLKKTEAAFDEVTKIFSPPAQQICFHADYRTEGSGLIRAFASQNNLDTKVAEEFFSETIDVWKTKLYHGETLVIEKLGRFIRVGDEIILQGEKIVKNNPDFYGLETINLSGLEHKRKSTTSKRTIWVVITLLIILILGIVAMTQPEIIFGKKSNISTEPASKTIQK